MNKRGQITVFVVLGLVIAAIFLMMYFFQENMLNKQTFSNFARNIGLVNEKTAVRDFVQECAEQTGMDALMLIGMQGGYALPEKYALFNGLKVAYGYYEGKNALARENEIKGEIGKYYVYFMPECVDGLNGYELEKGNISVKVGLQEDRVDVTLDYPIYIKKKDSKTLVGDMYNINYNVGLRRMRDIANNLVQMKVENENAFDLYYLSSMSDSFNVEIVKINEGDICIIQDLRAGYDMANYTFMFAEKLKRESK